MTNVTPTAATASGAAPAPAPDLCPKCGYKRYGGMCLTNPDCPAAVLPNASGATRPR